MRHHRPLLKATLSIFKRYALVSLSLSPPPHSTPPHPTPHVPSPTLLHLEIGSAALLYLITQKEPAIAEKQEHI